MRASGIHGTTSVLYQLYTLGLSNNSGGTVNSSVAAAVTTSSASVSRSANYNVNNNTNNCSSAFTDITISTAAATTDSSTATSVSADNHSVNSRANLCSNSITNRSNTNRSNSTMLATSSDNSTDRAWMQTMFTRLEARIDSLGTGDNHSSSRGTVADSSAAIPSTAIFSAATTNRTMSSTDWPVDASLRLIHELWYDGNRIKRFAPYRLVVPDATWPTTVKKLVTFARGCVVAVDQQLTVTVATYLAADCAQRDVYILEAFNRLCDVLIARGHPATAADLLSKLQTNKISSIYENDLKYLRKTITHRKE